MRRLFSEIVHILLSFALITAATALPVTSSSAASPSNIGLAGLWEYPTAEMPGDGNGYLYYSYSYPYRVGGASIGFFPWLEFNLRLTEFSNTMTAEEVSGSEYADYGHYKDKAIDLKLLLINQRGLRPSVAVGVMDMLGTEIRKAYFAAGTWKVGEFAVTAGYASDAYNGFYGGVSWSPLDWLELKAEYSPLDYTNDHGWGYPHPDDADSKLNVGMVLKSPWGLNGSISYQRGEELCFGLNYAFDMRKSVAGKRRKPETSTPASADWADTDIQAMASSLQEKLGQKGFGLRNTVVLAGERKVHAAFENIGYSSQAEAIARAVVLAAFYLPWDTDTFSCAAMVRGVPVTRVELNREQLALIRLQKFTANDISRSAIAWAPRTKYGTMPGEEWDVMAGPRRSIRNGSAEIRVALALEPRIDRSLKQNVYVDRKDIDYMGRLRSSSGWEAYLKVRQPLENNVDIWWEPEMSDKTRIWQGVLSYLYKFDSRLYALGEFGYLDYHYFGANVWGRYYMKNSPFWLGGRLTLTKERDYDSFAGLADYGYKVDEAWKSIYQTKSAGDNGWNTSWWAEGGYHDALYNADIKAGYGKFADGDKGYRIDARRTWNDVTVGFYYTDTDISEAKKRYAGLDRSYTDAGMYLHIPLSFWYAGHPSNTYYDKEFTLLSTFAVDAGRVPGSWMPPERLIGELTPATVGQELGLIMDSLMTLTRGDEEEVPAKKEYGLVEYLTGEWQVNETLKEASDYTD